MDGVPVIQAAYSDVTELQRVERERDSTYDSIPGGVAKVLIGTQLSLLEANDNFFQMLGTDRTAYKGTLSAVAPADRRRNRNRVHGSRRNGCAGRHRIPLPPLR